MGVHADLSASQYTPLLLVSSYKHVYSLMFVCYVYGCFHLSADLTSSVGEDVARGTASSTCTTSTIEDTSVIDGQSFQANRQTTVTRMLILPSIIHKQSIPSLSLQIIVHRLFAGNV